MVSKKAMTKKQLVWKYLFGFVLIVAGIVFESFGVGQNFLITWSLGTWLIYVGFLMFAIITLSYFNKKERIIDERMEKIAYKASRVTFVFVILGAFGIMIYDGINPIDYPYHMFMSHFIAWTVLVYFIAYKVIEKRS